MSDLFDPAVIETTSVTSSSSMVVVTLSREDVAGTRVTYQFAFPHTDEDFYIGLVALDESNNTGRGRKEMTGFRGFFQQTEYFQHKRNVSSARTMPTVFS
jgi:hypothetical protein